MLADVSDNAGGGAPGDSTFLLRRLLERGVKSVVAGTYYDPGAVELCAEAGTGATHRSAHRRQTRPGIGRSARLARRSLRAVVENHRQTAMDCSAPVPLGRSAWVSVDGIDIVLASVRSQVFFPDAFTGMGIPLETYRIVALKSTHHFWAGFSAIAKRAIYVNAPGALQLDFANIAYKTREPALLAADREYRMTDELEASIERAVADWPVVGPWLRRYR